MSETHGDNHETPKPAHVRTIERIRYYASPTAFYMATITGIEAVIDQLADRVIGVALPTPRKPAPGALLSETGPYEYDLAIPNEVMAALGELEVVNLFAVDMEPSHRRVRAAMAWVRKEYLDNPMYAYKYPVQPATDPAPAPDA